MIMIDSCGTVHYYNITRKRSHHMTRDSSLHVTRDINYDVTRVCTYHGYPDEHEGQGDPLPVVHLDTSGRTSLSLH